MEINVVAILNKIFVFHFWSSGNLDRNQCSPGMFISRIPDTNFSYPGSRVKKIPGSRIQGQKDFRIRIKEFKYFNPKNSSRIRIPGPDLDFFTHPGSRIRG
jgi:hypothetical protein